MQRQTPLWFHTLVVSAVLLGVLAFVPSVQAVSKGDILDHADIPRSNDVADNKYAVIAKFTSKSKRILTGSTRKDVDNKDVFVDPSNSQKGKIKALYTNVATYKGRMLDFELVATDWEKAGFNGGETFYFYKNSIGFNQSGYDYVKLNGTYKYHDTGKAATDLTGSYMTVNDLDANQFLAFDSGMMRKIDKMYAYDNSWVSYWKTGSKTNIGAKFWQALDTDDKRGYVTFLVDGYQLDFEWHKDWSEPSSNNNPYNLDHYFDWYGNNGYTQYFGYRGEKPIRTEVLKPTKKIVDENGKQQDSNTITAPESFSYEVYHTVPAEFPEFYYDTYVMKDVIHGALSIDNVKVYDAGDKDVTSRFSVSTSGQTITAKAKSSSLSSNSFYGEDYRFVIDVTANASSKLLDYADGDDHFAITNTATVTVDGGKQSTNSVKTTVKLPRTDVAMKKIRIYTDRAADGLPVRLNLTTHNDFGMYKDDTIKIELHDKDRNKRVATKEVALKDITDTIKMKVPSNELQKDTVRNYEAVIADYDGNHIRVQDGVRTINTDGHTAKEGVLQTEEPFTGVVLTERKLGESMKKYNETVRVSYEPTTRVKAGYGVEIAGNVTYSNEKLEDVLGAVDINRTVDAIVNADYSLIDTSLSYYDNNRTYENGDTIAVDLLRKDESNNDDSSQVTYQLPKVFLEQRTGYTFTEQQKEEGKINGPTVDAGHKLYIPVWVDELGTYDMAFQTSDPIGSHHMKIDVKDSVEVYAYMFHHTDSETPDDDEILLHPMPQSDDLFNWDSSN